MKKKIIKGVGMLLLIMGVSVFNMNSVFRNDGKLSVLSLANVEALANDDETGSGNTGDGYHIKDKNCGVETQVDGEGYVTIFGNRFKAIGATAGGRYTETYRDAARDCTIGGTDLCSTYTCGQFYIDMNSQ